MMMACAYWVHIRSKDTPKGGWGLLKAVGRVPPRNKKVLQIWQKIFVWGNFCSNFCKWYISPPFKFRMVTSPVQFEGISRGYRWSTSLLRTCKPLVSGSRMTELRRGKCRVFQCLGTNTLSQHFESTLLWPNTLRGMVLALRWPILSCKRPSIAHKRTQKPPKITLAYDFYAILCFKRLYVQHSAMLLPMQIGRIGGL